MDKIFHTQPATIAGPLRTRDPRENLALVEHATDHPLDDETIIQQLANAIANGPRDRDSVFAMARRLVGHEAAVNIGVHQLLSVEEIAVKFNLCTRSIWRLVDRGELPPPILVGGARRWFARDIDNYLKKLTEKRDGIQRRRN